MAGCNNLRHSQVDLDKVVEGNFLRQWLVGQWTFNRFGSCLGSLFFAGFDHGVHLLFFDALHQWFKGINFVIGQWLLNAVPVQAVIEELFTRRGHCRQHRLQIRENHPKQIDPQGADILHLLVVALILVLLPWLFSGNIFIGGIGLGHNFADRLAKVTVLEVFGNSLCRATDLIPEFRVFDSGGEHAVIALGNKLGASAGNIDHFAHQVTVDLLLEVFQVEVDIFHRTGEFGGVVVAQVLRIEVVQVTAGIDKGAAGFGHFLAVNGNKTVHTDFCRRAELGAAEHGGPEQGVEVDNILADKVV